MPKPTPSWRPLSWGIVAVFVGVAFWWSLIKNPFHEYTLIRASELAKGVLVETHEDEREDYRGHVYFSDVGVYSFHNQSGLEFKTTYRAPTGELPQIADVE